MKEIIKFKELNSQNWSEFEELIMKSQLSFPEVLRDDSETYFNILSLNDSIGIVMLLNDTYIGNAIGFPDDNYKMFLYNLSVEKEYQRNGYGYKLLEEFINRTQNLGYSTIVGNFRNTSLSLVKKFDGIEREVLKNYYESGEDYYCYEINVNNIKENIKENNIMYGVNKNE